MAGEGGSPGEGGEPRGAAPVARVAGPRARAAALLLAASLLAGCALGGVRLSPPGPFARPAPPATERYRFVVFGDTQSMAPIDWVMPGGPAEREQVRARIEALRPDFVVHTGDLVGNGSFGTEWRTFRAEYGRLPIWPVLGNHDLAGPNERALASYFDAFPHLKGLRWYVLRQPPLAFIMLDSNHADLSQDDWRRERAWLAAELDRAQADPAVRAIVLVAHHPPFSVHAIGGNRRVREAFFEEAARRSKFVAFLSGHHHAYQHIRVGERHAFATGGGGAPLFFWKRAALPPGALLVEAREAHHVLEVRVESGGLVVLVHALSAKGDGGWDVVEETLIPWPGLL